MYSARSQILYGCIRQIWYNNGASKLSTRLRVAPFVAYLLIFCLAQVAMATDVTVRVENSQAKGIDSVEIQYYKDKWKTIGETDQSGNVTSELAPGPYGFRAIYKGAVSRLNQDISQEPKVVFRTVPITLRAEDSKGKGIAGGTAQYFGSGWKTIGTTDTDGEITTELVVGKHGFRMSVGGAVIRIDQDISQEPKVVFRIVAAATK